MAGKIRFGVYELDFQSTELRKHGIRVRLQDQPFQVLAHLLERPGQLVTREELKKRIWSEDTFVDFDQSLNKAVNRLREALNDDASRPRYVETIPRRGYRFVAPITAEAPNGQPVLASPPPLREEPNHGAGRRISPRSAAIAAAAAVILIVAGLALWARLRNPAARLQRTPIRVTRDGVGDTPTISRDGKLLAYSSKSRGGALHIWIRQVAGGEPVQVTTGADDDSQPDFSPDGTEIAFRSERAGGGIYIAPALGGGEPRLLARHGIWPRFSPSGREILYFSDEPSVSQAYLVSAQGGAPRLFLPDWRIWCGFWEPNGKAILVYGARKGAPYSKNWMLASVEGGAPAPFHLPGDNYRDSRFPMPTAWRRSREGCEWIIFGSGSGDTYNLFRVRVIAERVAGEPEQLTSGTGANYPGDLSTDGSLVFTVGAYGGQIWMVPADTNRAQTQGPPQQITSTDGVLNDTPAVSRDGRLLVYTAIIPVSKEAGLHVRDLTTGAERRPIEGRGLGWASISPDGSRIAYVQVVSRGTADMGRPVTYLIAAAGGDPAQLCQDCDPRGFSSDGSLLLTQQGYMVNGRARAVAVRVPGGDANEFLADPQHPLWHAFFSWDDRWVSFKVEPEESLGKLMIAPVRNGVPAGEREWIAVTDGQYADDKPQFSPDGNTLYFTSERDGHICIWARRLDPVTKRPVGAPFVVQHFHNPQWRIAGNRTHTELGVAKDKIVTNFREIRGDIWMMKLDEPTPGRPDRTGR